MKRVLLVVAVAACGGGSSADQQTNLRAETAFFGAYGAMEQAQAQALAAAAQALRAPVAQTLDFTGPCTASGTEAVQGTYDGDGSTMANYALDFTAAQCSDGQTVLDGTVHWTGSVSGSDVNEVVTETIDGTIAYQGPMFAGTFEFDNITITTTVSGSNVAVTITGGYTIGGVTYTIDQSSWSSAFGG